MPTVPTKDNLTVRPNLQNAGVRFSNTQSLGAAGLAGAKLQEQGNAMLKAGAQAAKFQLELQEEANQLRVDDAINQAREEAVRLQYDKDEGFDNLRGYDALERPNGVPLTEEYGTKLQERLSAIAETLGNDRQKELFETQSGRLLSSFRSETERHEGSQFREYTMSVRRGTIQNRTQEIALNYQNNEVIEDGIRSIDAAARDLGRMEGLSAAEREASARKAKSKAHMVVIETAIQKEDSVYADDYFKKNARSMDADDILRVNNVLGEQLDTKIAIEVVGQVMNEHMDDLITPDSDRAFNIALNTESGGAHFGGAGSVAGDGEPTTSPKGAIGVAQIMPETGPEAAKFAGVEWDEERFRKDPAYNRALGKAYFEKQLQDFGGSLAKAYAAYNAGPTATRGAVKAAENGKEGKTWLDYLPAETRNYVQKNMDAFGAGKGRGRRPTLLEVQNAVRERVGTESPRRLKLALSEAETRYDVVTKAIKQEEDRAVSSAMQELIANGGNYAALDPMMRSAIPPTEVGKVMDFAKKLSKGEDNTNLVLYNQFMENPRMLAALTDDEFLKLRTELDETDFKMFSKMRSEILNGSQADADNPASLNNEAIKRAVDNRLLSMGIKTTGEDDAQQVGAIRKFVNQAVIVSQTANGKRMNDADVDAFVDKLFSERATYDGWWDTEGPVLGTQYKYIPKATRREIEAAFKRQGIKPTQQEVTEAYWRHVFFTRRAKEQGKGSY